MHAKCSCFARIADHKKKIPFAKATLELEAWRNMGWSFLNSFGEQKHVGYELMIRIYCSALVVASYVCIICSLVYMNSKFKSFGPCISLGTNGCIWMLSFSTLSSTKSVLNYSSFDFFDSKFNHLSYLKNYAKYFFFVVACFINKNSLRMT